MSTLSHLIYISRATTPFTGSELKVLADAAQQRNATLGISGLLLYADGWFMQLLEGEQEAVEQLYYESTANDLRHTDCMVLMNEPCMFRLFPQWHMGRLYLQDSQGERQASWDAMCAEIMRQKPQAIFARVPAVHLLYTFIKHAGAVSRESETVMNEIGVKWPDCQNLIAVLGGPAPGEANCQDLRRAV